MRRCNQPVLGDGSPRSDELCEKHLQESRRLLEAIESVRHDEHIQRFLGEAEPLRPEQRARIAAILNQGDLQAKASPPVPGRCHRAL